MRVFKVHGRLTAPNVHPTHLVMTTHLIRLSTPTPINRDSGLNSGFFYVFSKGFFPFFYSCTSSFSALLQTSLLKEPSKTLDTSTTFYFPVSVCNSNLFRVSSLLDYLNGWRCSITFRKGFWFTFFRFYPW